jgi:UDP-N-acetylmuramate dehydrogenase
MTAFRKQLEQLFGTALRRDEALAPWTWMKVGGPAEFLVEVEGIEALAAAHETCRRCGAPFTLLGGGSNVIIDDAGLAGLVVINRLAHLEWAAHKRRVTVGAGFSLDRLVEAVSLRGWGDLTFAAGIPGTVGGALAGGAGVSWPKSSARPGSFPPTAPWTRFRWTPWACATGTATSCGAGKS